MIKEAPADAAEAYRVFVEESKSIGTVQDLDYLFVKLRGKGAEEIIKEIEEQEEEKVQNDSSASDVEPASILVKPEREEVRQEEPVV